MYKNQLKYNQKTTQSFTGKERDSETGFSYFGARYYDSDLMTGWLSVDPMADKYPNISPYAYCAWNPIKLVDPDGEEWKDAEGNVIKDHSNIKVYIFYDPKDFDKQSRQMYRDAENKYGKGSVALSDVTTTDEFAQDWKNMASTDIREVNLNYHGTNQAVHLNSSEVQYLTSTGTGLTNKLKNPAKNIQDLPQITGNIENAQLNINTCHSNQHNSSLTDSKLTVMEAFSYNFSFKIIRGTSFSVSYSRVAKQPFPGRTFNQGVWEYMKAGGVRISTKPRVNNYNTPLYYRTGGAR